MSLLQVSWPLLWRQAAHRRHSQHHRGGQTCAGAWHTSSSIPPIPRPGGHQDALRLAITPTHHPRALAHHPCCLWSPVEASGGAAGFKSTDLSSIFSAAENSWIWLLLNGSIFIKCPASASSLLRPASLPSLAFVVVFAGSSPCVCVQNAAQASIAAS